MTNFKMPQHVVDRVIEKRGRLNVFESFDPTKTAFLVIDMQNFFVSGVSNFVEDIRGDLKDYNLIKELVLKKKAMFHY